MNRTGAKNIVDRKVTAMMWDRINNSQSPGRKQVRYPLMSGGKRSPLLVGS